eukprot:Hpha_TRINITY_DN6869_c0_g1::TRINITY_DN6869_c0_g1_i2::g.46157::m.46157/K21398/SLC11A2, DMT1, NRAMP2; natural resistance-associated macrophage protein 2
MIELALIAADCQEVIGSALAINILSNQLVPLWVGALLTASSCFIFMLLDTKGVRKLEALFCVLIGSMVVAFGFQVFSRPPHFVSVSEGMLVPRVEGPDSFQTAAGMVGAVIMPHNIFLHSGLVLSRRVERDFSKHPDTARGQVGEALLYNTIESAGALLVSLLINLAVVCVFARLPYFGADGKPSCSYEDVPICPGRATDPAGCAQIGLLSAGDCLRTVYSEGWWIYVWAIGLLAAGQASTISGTYAGQFIMTGFLDMPVSLFWRTIFSRAFALIPALAFAIAAPGHPETMDSLNAAINVLQAAQIPFAMLPALYFASSPRHMGGGFEIKGLELWCCWVVLVLVLVCNASAVTGIFSALQGVWRVLGGVLVALYCVAVAYLSLVAAGLRSLSKKVETK